jgi:hypothetical protein
MYSCWMTVLEVNLSFVQDDFIKLEGIHTLDLSRNHLTKLPENFGQLKSLRQLDLYDNRISDLPISFCDLTKLDVSVPVQERRVWTWLVFALVLGSEG